MALSTSGGTGRARWILWWMWADGWNCSKANGQNSDHKDTTNLDYVRGVVGKGRVASGAVICRARHGYPLGNGFRAVPVEEIG